MMRLIVVAIFAAIFVVQDAQSAMTEQQFESAVKLLRKVCQPKTKVTNEQIEAIHKGQFSTDQDIMCYMDCILRTGQIMKDGKMNMESLTTQMSNLPPSMAEPGIKSINNCKTAAQSTAKCESAYQFYKCFYEDNPSNFFLP